MMSSRSSEDARSHFTWLLVALFVLLAIGPVLRLWFDRGQYPLFKAVTFNFAFSALLIVATFSVTTSRRVRRIAWALVAATILCRVSHLSSDVAAFLSIGYVFSIAFLGLILYVILRALFRVRSADRETLSAALCVYLLQGLLWAVVFALLEELQPGSFRLSDPDASFSLGGEDPTYPIYFSYVTLTTVGYGDVTPVMPTARMLAVCEAMLGQIFLIVLVARLVGLSVAQAAARGDADD